VFRCLIFKAINRYEIEQHKRLCPLKYFPKKETEKNVEKFYHWGIILAHKAINMPNRMKLQLVFTS
jgi:hypothetical protein